MTARKLIFYFVMLTPLMLIAALPIYALFFTNIPQIIYTGSIRNLFFDCLDFVPDNYVYKMKPGPCRLANIEYDVTSISDANGFRQSTTTGRPEIAVIGDSHAYGYGVADDQTFARLLEAVHGHPTINLAIGSYATAREMEVLSRYGADAPYVVLQYCQNDRAENAAFLRLSREEFTASVETGWRAVMRRYRDGKAKGIFRPLEHLGIILGSLSFERKSTWRKRLYAERSVTTEAEMFAQIISRYQSILSGRRLIVLDSSDWGTNSPEFKTALSAELTKLAWLQYRVLDTATILSENDYYFLDEHLRPQGHQKLAAAIAHEITDWKSVKHDRFPR